MSALGMARRDEWRTALIDGEPAALVVDFADEVLLETDVHELGGLSLRIDCKDVSEKSELMAAAVRGWSLDMSAFGHNWDALLDVASDLVLAQRSQRVCLLFSGFRATSYLLVERLLAVMSPLIEKTPGKIPLIVATVDRKGTT